GALVKEIVAVASKPANGTSTLASLVVTFTAYSPTFFILLMISPLILTFASLLESTFNVITGLILSDPVASNAFALALSIIVLYALKKSSLKLAEVKFTVVN